MTANDHQYAAALVELAKNAQQQPANNEGIYAEILHKSLPSHASGSVEPDIDLLLALVDGARQLAQLARIVELTAAELARRHGATVRQLALSAAISERAANDRYRRPSGKGAIPAHQLHPKSTETGRVRSRGRKTARTSDSAE